MRTEHTLSNGQTVWLETMTGVVTEISTREDHHVRQTPSEVETSVVSVGGRSGIAVTTKGGQIYTETVTTSEAWLQMDDGHDKHVSLGQFQLAMRKGHRITLVKGGRADAPSAGCMAVSNHNTKLWNFNLDFANQQRWDFDLGQKKVVLIWILSCGLLAALLYALTSRDPGSGGLIGFFVFGSIIGLMSQMVPVALFIRGPLKSLEGEIEQLAKSRVRDEIGKYQSSKMNGDGNSDATDAKLANQN